MAELEFQFPLGIRWCSDVQHWNIRRQKPAYFNSPWELDDVRTKGRVLNSDDLSGYFNSPWELDDVRTVAVWEEPPITNMISIPPGN